MQSRPHFPRWCTGCGVAKKNPHGHRLKKCRTRSDGGGRGEQQSPGTGFQINAATNPQGSGCRRWAPCAKGLPAERRRAGTLPMQEGRAGMSTATERADWHSAQEATSPSSVRRVFPLGNPLLSRRLAAQTAALPGKMLVKKHAVRSVFIVEGLEVLMTLLPTCEPASLLSGGYGHRSPRQRPGYYLLAGRGQKAYLYENDSPLLGE